MIEIYLHEFMAYGNPNVILGLIRTKVDGGGYGVDALEQAEQLYAQMLGWA